MAVLALVAAAQVVRSAIVQDTVARRPDLAAMAWPSHPQVELALAMAEIGVAAGKGLVPGAASLERSEKAAARAPLAVEPYLIEGAMAQSAGQASRAERLFSEAYRRDPRSTAARFFLAQLTLVSGRPGEGLRHASVLARLVAGGPAALVPAIAQYAKSPGAVPTLKRIFSGDRELREAVLAELARDATNFDLVMALVGGTLGDSQQSVAPWQANLLHALVERGEVSRAHALWSRISGLRSAPQGIFNPGFAKLAAPAPFNWTLSGGDFGFAEPAAGGGLQVIYYGRANALFANQTLLLAPGRYAIAMQAARTSDGDGTSGLAWAVTCAGTSETLLNLAIGGGKGVSRKIAGRFTVPAGCSSQALRLIGTAQEYAPSEQVTINDLKLVREAS